jgi:hypothetical protein
LKIDGLKSNLIARKKIITKFTGFVEEDLKKKKRKYVGVIVDICCYMGFE